MPSRSGQDSPSTLQHVFQNSPSRPRMSRGIGIYTTPLPRTSQTSPQIPKELSKKNPGNAHHGLKDYTRHLPQDAPKSWLWCLSTLQHFHQDSPRQPSVANILSRLCKIPRGIQGMSRESSRRAFPGNPRGNSKRLPNE